jgi:tocopherol O-methyltransferase
MISYPGIQKKSIRFHYDLITPFYRMFWGSHIHHGLWSGAESPRQAQQQLTEALAAEAVRSGDRVLDVGCGMGGSAIHLARALDCRVSGVTLSRVQQRWATGGAWLRRVGRRADFRCADAESLELPPQSFDVIWSIECTEHLFDKPAFFRRAASWLRPGGRIAICAWLAGDVSHAANVRQVEKVCKAFLCPSLGSMSDYQQWMADAGLTMKVCHDWTARVEQTWQVCRDRVERSKVRYVARAFGRETASFLEHFETILQAYQSGAMQYGALVFEKR